MYKKVGGIPNFFFRNGRITVFVTLNGQYLSKYIKKRQNIVMEK